MWRAMKPEAPVSRIVLDIDNTLEIEELQQVRVK
jgi:hypothetical protein